MATIEGSEDWVPVHPNFWRINKDSREIVFQSLGHPGYALLQLIGRGKPTLLTSDSDTCDIEPEYIIAKATSLALRARMDRNADQRQASQVEADRHEALAQQALARQQTPSETRWVSD